MYEYKIEKIYKIYDGDTITVELDLGFGVHKKEKLRLANIDAPEIRGKSRPEGLKSKDWLVEQLLVSKNSDIPLIIKTNKDRKGKYGRYIAEIFINDISINEKMITEGFATRYV